MASVRIARAALVAFGAFALLAAAPAKAETVGRWRSYVAEASGRFGVPVEWIERVMRAESGGRTMLGGRPIVSRAGAMGLMQLMPGTWADMRARLGLGNDPHAPRDNILAGTYYLRLMYDRFGYPGLFGAYNAGPGRYSAYLAGRSRLPGETRAYMASVAGHRASAAPGVVVAPNGMSAMSRQQNAVFFPLQSQREGRADRGSESPSLFVRRTAAVNRP